MQKSIQCNGYPYLKQGDKVSYEIEIGEDGRRKAVNVTDPDGNPLQVRFTKFYMSYKRGN